MPEPEGVEIDATLKDGDILDLAGTRFEVLHTPGHTQGSVSLLIPSANRLLAGDTLFRDSIGENGPSGRRLPADPEVDQDRLAGSGRFGGSCLRSRPGNNDRQGTGTEHVPARTLSLPSGGKLESSDMSKRILLVTGDSGESYEALYAMHRFEEAGHEAVVAAPSARRLHLVMHDFEPGWDTYIERQGYGVTADIAFGDVSVEEYDAVLLLGGRAPEFLRHIPRVIEMVREFASQRKPIFSICHGIQILVAANLLQGRTVTCYEHVRSEVERAGATYSTEQAVRDKNIVSAQTWESHPQFYRRVFESLEA